MSEEVLVGLLLVLKGEKCCWSQIGCVILSNTTAKGTKGIPRSPYMSLRLKTKTDLWKTLHLSHNHKCKTTQIFGYSIQSRCLFVQQEFGDAQGNKKGGLGTILPSLGVQTFCL